MHYAPIFLTLGDQPTRAMPEFLRSPVNIHDTIEEMILRTDEFFFLISPYLYYVPASISQAFKKSNERNIPVTVVYKKGLVSHGKEVDYVHGA